MKKIISFILSVILCFAVMPFSAFAEDNYEAQLKAAGFTSRYIPALKALHEKYPNWQFEAVDIGMTLEAAVQKERNTHKQQLIQNISQNNGKDFYCNCSKCLVNGKYVVREGKTWISASEYAVKYYMNPINFLDERYIYQFETTDYEDYQTVSGVEEILKNTWMYNSYIAGYTPKTKYSDAIMAAAKDSGVSAYYLASKIVQEVGGSTASATGASGKNSTYPGIYNYYNINAATGGLDGLKWAAVNVKQTENQVSTDNSKLRAKPTTSSSILATLPIGTTVTILDSVPGTTDSYTWYKVSVNGKTGYIRCDLVGNRYNRPWTNPYTSIYYGAKWIADSFGKTQNTGYFQKFNVNPASSDRFYHEYMANVQAAASEAGLKYKAYSNGDILSKTMKFIIPVYSDLTFMDIDGYAEYSEYTDYIAYTSVYNSFITGTNPPYNTVFSPKTAITRAMFITILYRMAGSPYDNGKNPYGTKTPFADITNTAAYYYNAACWALDKGVTDQIIFKPNDNVTREQAATMLFRYAQSNNMISDDSYKSVNITGYKDYSSIRDWAVEPMQWANYNKMITGTQQGYANPQGSTLRIHATKILYGFGKTYNIGNFE